MKWACGHKCGSKRCDIITNTLNGVSPFYPFSINFYYSFCTNGIKSLVFLEGLFLHIEITISRQLISLITTIAYYNYLHQFLDPNLKLYQVTVGSPKYTCNVQNLVTTYYFEENYWRIFTQMVGTHLAKIKESKIFSNFVWLVIGLSHHCRKLWRLGASQK